MSFLGDVVAWFTDAARWDGSPSSIPQRLAEHVRLTLVSMVLAALVAVPLGVLLGHLRRYGTLAQNVGNVGRALPSFAILVLGAQLWGISQVFGMSKAAVVALVALAIPPLLTTSYVAVAEVPDTVRSTARAMGMTGSQALWRAELPLAMPLLWAGVRLATLQVVATATLAAVVASGGLGRYIVDGFATQDEPQIVGGAVLVAALALSIEGVLALLSRVVIPRPLQDSRQRWAVAHRKEPR